MDRTRSTWLAALILAAAGVLAQAIRSTEPPDPGPLHLADAAPGAPFADDALEPEFLDLLRPREILYRTYEETSDSPVWVFLAYFDRQKEGSQVHSPRHCYPGSGWSIEEESGGPAPWGRDVHAIVVSNGRERRLVCYWYQLPRGIVSDVFSLKLSLMRAAVRHHIQDVVFANVSTPIAADREAAFARIAPYAGRAQSEIRRLYRERDEARAHSH